MGRRWRAGRRGPGAGRAGTANTSRWHSGQPVRSPSVASTRRNSPEADGSGARAAPRHAAAVLRKRSPLWTSRSPARRIPNSTRSAAVDQRPLQRRRCLVTPDQLLEPMRQVLVGPEPVERMRHQLAGVGEEDQPRRRRGSAGERRRSAPPPFAPREWPRRPAAPRARAAPAAGVRADRTPARASASPRWRATVRFARLTASSSAAAASRTSLERRVAPRAQLLPELLEELLSILLRRRGPGEAARRWHSPQSRPARCRSPSRADSNRARRSSSSRTSSSSETAGSGSSAPSAWSASASSPARSPDR